jgi:hypothetical protein
MASYTPSAASTGFEKKDSDDVGIAAIGVTSVNFFAFCYSVRESSSTFLILIVS